METINYLVRTTELMVLLTLVYQVFLRSTTFYQLNRFYLLLTGLTSFIVPLFFDGAGDGASSVTYLQTVYVNEPTSLMTAPVVSTEWNLVDTVLVIYIVGVGLAALFLSYRLFRLYVLLHKARYSGTGNTWYLPASAGNVACSFLHRIYLPETFSTEEKEMVWQHERVHVRQLHTIDLLFYELLCVVFWFNPLYRLSKKALMATHEFIADQEAGRSNEVDYARLLVARALGVPMNTIHSFSNQIFLKRRLFMLNKKRSPKKLAFLYLLALPLVAATFFVQSFTFTTRVQPASAVQPGTDKAAEYVGGQDAMVKYLSDNLNYPAEAKAKKIEGKVYVEFTVDADGKVKAVSAKRKVNPLLDAEAIRLVSSMPKWSPGEKEGKKVSTTLILPISFQLEKK